MHATTDGTAHVIKLPAAEIESVRGRVPIQVRHELYAHPAALVIRSVITIYDQPDRPLTLETMTNIAETDQRADFARLTTQKELLLLFYDEHLRHRLSKNGVDAPALDLQFVMNGGESRTYDPATNKTIVGSPDLMTYSGLRLLDGVFAGRKIGAALQLGGGAPPASKLTQGTLNGVGVYSITQGDMGTLYFNDQSYRLEGLNWTDGSRSWQARLLNETVVPLASAPAGTFDLHAPASAQTVASQAEGPGKK
jgi:hypothetical protein